MGEIAPRGTTVAFLILACIGSACSAATAEQKAGQVEEVDLPVARARIDMRDTGDKPMLPDVAPAPGRFSRVQLVVEADSRSPTGYRLPKDVNDAGVMLERMLPPDFYGAVVLNFDQYYCHGIYAPESQVQSRSIDLFSYLMDIWGLNDPASHLRSRLQPDPMIRYSPENPYWAVHAIVQARWETAKGRSLSKELRCPLRAEWDKEIGKFCSDEVSRNRRPDQAAQLCK